VRDWTLDRRDAYPTMKEKAIFLTKMVTFESRQEAVEPFHGLIYDIYTSPALRRSELTTCLDICFLVGCRAKDVTIQENSIGLLDISVPIFLALHLLFGTLDGEQSLVPNSQASFIRNSSTFPPRVIAFNSSAPSYSSILRHLTRSGPRLRIWITQACLRHLEAWLQC
jgi:transformation/transcription domain-associated protein